MSAEKYVNPEKYKLAFIKTKSYAIIETQYSIKPNWYIEHCRLKRFLIVPTQVKQTNHCQMTLRELSQKGIILKLWPNNENQFPRKPNQGINNKQTVL